MLINHVLQSKSIGWILQSQFKVIGLQSEQVWRNANMCAHEAETFRLHPWVQWHNAMHCANILLKVKNLQAAVVCEAINTWAKLYYHLKKAMDPRAEGVRRALLLKLAQTTKTFIHQQGRLSLEAVVENCSNGGTVSNFQKTALKQDKSLHSWN